MNFPETAFFQFLYWLINTPGLGGAAVGFLGVGIVAAVGLVLRWIAGGGGDDEVEIYSHPTPALHSEPK